jgi:hypothetical protein
VVALVVTNDLLIAESEVPTVVRRGRMVVPAGQSLRVLSDGTVVLPKRDHALRSHPDSSHLPEMLKSLGWDLAEVHDR